MQRIRGFWNAFRNFAILFSFIMNFVLVVILLLVVQQIFMIKNGIAEPLIDGLHSNFVGLDQATIVSTVVVDDTIPINFTLPINQETTVVLTQAVPLNANTSFNLGEFGSINGTVSLNLPPGLALPVQLQMDVPVQSDIPILLNVPVNIALQDTQLHQPFVNLRDLFEPFVRSLDNLPSEWNDVPGFAGNAIAGDVNLMNQTDGSRDPWDEQAEWGVAAPQSDPVEATTTPVDPNTQPPATDPQGTFEPIPTIDPNFTPMPTATTVPLILPETNANAPISEIPVEPVGTPEATPEG